MTTSEKKARLFELVSEINRLNAEVDQLLSGGVQVEKPKPEKMKKARMKKETGGFDPANPPHSSCCDARAVVTKDGHLECCMCGSECDPNGTNPADEKMKARRAKRTPREPCPNCGSRGPRHKNGCTG